MVNIKDERTVKGVLDDFFSEKDSEAMNKPERYPPRINETKEEIVKVLKDREVYYSDPSAFQHEKVDFLDFTVDKGIQSVIEALWVVGAPTDFSCQGHNELCHRDLQNTDFYSQVVFLKVNHAINFYSLLTSNFGSGSIFSEEGFILNALDGYSEDIDTLNPTPEMVQEFNDRTRGEVLFHPAYLPLVRDLLDSVTSRSDFDAKRSELMYVESIDEAYELLEVDDKTRKLAARHCSCPEDH